MELVEYIDEISVVYQKGVQYKKEEHTHDFDQIIFSNSNKFIVKLGDSDKTLGKSKCLYLKSNTPHYFSCEAEKVDLLVINLPKKSLEEIEKHYKEKIDINKSFIFILSMNSRQLMNTFFSVENEILKKDILYSFIGCLFQDINHQKNHKLPKLQSKDKNLNQIVKYINQNFSNDIKVSELAKKHSYSPRNLSRVFKKEFGLTVKEYIIQKRIEKAKSLFREGKSNITDIAFTLGFSSTSHFLDTYKKYTGNNLKNI